ncbi:uncharacterized protein CMU_033990 [Cryptosporidium muris RN66]|uniref:Uncharacterized protein n=1 Tax=Cryptosporidium muris (strain RN66) TaxID=441375 RepID=B6AFM3_CRYMR|nr:uncharacterized protein CMU_033990 [Cryptosporidium muris RN66]EEA07014.1 hypothetical protein, conserved [Cryptosporidium muris RN66]|eukprot:XP_002141363.1 hypothetical protein [Cryptosporidium muris RN66]
MIQFFNFSFLVATLIGYLPSKIYSLPITTEPSIKEYSRKPGLLNVSISEHCSSEPCNCCSEKLQSMALDYASRANTPECKDFMKNLFCTLACNEESADAGSLSNNIMIMLVCEHECSNILSKCSKPKSIDTNIKDVIIPTLNSNNTLNTTNGTIKALTSNIDLKSIKLSSSLNYISNQASIGASGIPNMLSTIGSSISSEPSECAEISLPPMTISNSAQYSLAFIHASSDSKVCVTSTGGFNLLVDPIASTSLLTANNTAIVTSGSTLTPPIILTDSSGKTTQNIGLTMEELHCGFCFSRCCCWPVWSGSIIAFIGYILIAFLAIYWQSGLFSQGLKSSHFWKGGGYWLAGSGSLGIIVGMLVGGLVSSCIAGALTLGGSLCNLFMSILLVGRLGAVLGALGGLGTGAVIGIMAHSGTVSWAIGLSLGFLLGLVVGFSPIARSLRMNDRFIRRGIRQREMRRRSRLGQGSYHSDFFSEGSGTDHNKNIATVQRYSSSDSHDAGNNIGESRNPRPSSSNSDLQR